LIAAAKFFPLGRLDSFNGDGDIRNHPLSHNLANQTILIMANAKRRSRTIVE
jgi:hypothetical protein